MNQKHQNIPIVVAAPCVRDYDFLYIRQLIKVLLKQYELTFTLLDNQKQNETKKGGRSWYIRTQKLKHYISSFYLGIYRLIIYRKKKLSILPTYCIYIPSAASFFVIQSYRK